MVEPSDATLRINDRVLAETQFRINAICSATYSFSLYHSLGSTSRRNITFPKTRKLTLEYSKPQLRGRAR